MRSDGNTIMITGGASGIGKALAEALHKLGNQVILCGRRTAALAEAAEQHDGMAYYQLDVTSPESIAEVMRRAIADFPNLNVLINNAGIMIAEDLQTDAIDLSASLATITTNLVGPIRLTASLLPHLRRQPAATVMMVSSGLAFTPLAMTPTYCATKAAIHSYAQSLRYQLKETSVEVLELAPPYVQTELMGSDQASDPRAMPLDEFITESVGLLTSGGTPQGEILVERVKPLRFGEANGNYEEVFAGLNGAQHLDE
ncbi:SDR family oxidoreductase [Blastopirellula retiformator]|uniref:Putative oxidoreductase n=1 Tax=Blastopirellula retiformator TaxID=2527970 RepID=A0A5C5VNT4_9BACT|nr:SDR family NAD(P)-dependent oxidoreductase [Blastopirellula retiformator]TWT39292.1 putative oxidoreductase [Blastopirellula retiformator]